MLSRWLVVQVPVRSSDACITAGNCETKDLAQSLVDALEMQSDNIFRVVGPITENMIQGKVTEEDVAQVVAEMECVEMLMHGGHLH